MMARCRTQSYLACLAAWLRGSACALAVVLPAIAVAAEFRSIGDRPAVLYDAPATKASKLHILSPQQPVEVVVKLDKWSKVRDVSGELSWVENGALADRRWVVVTSATGEARAQARASAPVVFEARKGVVLELSGPPVDGFAPVRHRDGASGFVAISQLWGL